jgi:VWFA-related protein
VALRVSACATLCAWTARAGPAQAPRFGSEAEAVHVDAFVTRGGNPVLGLRAANFELRDNGLPQRVELVAVESQPLAALLVLDTSNSVEGAKLAALRSAGEAFLTGLRPQDAIGLVSFSHELRLLAAPTRERPPVRAALAAMRAQGGTAVWDALHAALLLLPPRSRSLVVVFSDGIDNLSFLDESQVRSEAERSNALVHVVGVRSDDPAQRAPEPEHLRALRQTAEATGGRLWAAESPEHLQEAFAAIVAAMNTRYVLRYEPSSGPAAGWHEIELRLRGARGEVRARRGYLRRAPAPRRD